MKNKIGILVLLLLANITLVSAQESGEITEGVTGFLKGTFSIFGSLAKYASYLAYGLIGLTVIGIIIWFIMKKTIWNLQVEFKIPRSDGKIVNAEWGKGFYNAKKGYILLKRPKSRAKIQMKPADPKKYIYGDNIITVTQIGPNTWTPVHPDSFTQYVDEDTGEVEYFIDLKTDLTDQLSWAEGFRRRSRDTFSIMSLLDRFQIPIAIGAIILIQTIGTLFIVVTVT